MRINSLFLDNTSYRQTDVKWKVRSEVKCGMIFYIFIRYIIHADNTQHTCENPSYITFVNFLTVKSLI